MGVLKQSEKINNNLCLGKILKNIGKCWCSLDNKRNLPRESRVVVTGLGLVTPVGIGVEDTWNSLLSGLCGVKSLEPTDLPEVVIIDI